MSAGVPYAPDRSPRLLTTSEKVIRAARERRAVGVSERHRIKFAAAFGGRTFTVVGRVDLRDTPHVFETPFGDRGVRGFLLRAEDTGELVCLGWAALVSARAYTAEIRDFPTGG